MRAKASDLSRNWPVSVAEVARLPGFATTPARILANSATFERTSKTAPLFGGMLMLILMLTASAVCGAADEPAPAGAPVSADAREAASKAWELESLQLRDGTVYEGLILAESQAEIEFAEVVRPAGKPMFSVIRPVDPQQVAQRVRLPPAQRAELLQRFDRFRVRARIEAGRMQDVPLHRETVASAEGWLYEGPWFRLESTTDEEMTRRCAVRIDQIFRAYRQVLRPTRKPPVPLRLIMFGDMDHYRQFVERSDFQIDSPAFYAAAEELIVAGSDLNPFAARLARVRAQHVEARRQYKELDDTFASRLAAVLAEMQANGYRSDEIEYEARLRRAAWQRELQSVLVKIENAERLNNSRFAEVTKQMFTRLYHEAFHAYVENFVYPRDQMPRWLNEGLAQIFETAQLDGDTLRIDAPDQVRLRFLQQDLAGGEPLRLAVLLASDREFLDMYRGQADQRRYAYAWGLAFYLVYEQNLLRGSKLDAYVANPDRLGPAERFARLTGQPLAEFEAQWRAAIRNLKR